jgi:hypothetical protein
MTDCQRCARPVGDAHVCSTCIRGVEKCLGNVTWLSEQLDLTIGRVTRFGSQTASRAAETPVAFNVKAGEARDVLRNVMVGWSKLYAEEAKSDLPADTLPSMGLFLVRRAEWFRHHELAVEFCDEIMSAVITAQRLVDSPANRTTFAVGPCPEETDGGPCPGEIRAYIPNDPNVVASMSCRVCGALYEPYQWLRAGRRILARRAERVAG